MIALWDLQAAKVWNQAQLQRGLCHFTSGGHVGRLSCNPAHLGFGNGVGKDSGKGVSEAQRGVSDSQLTTHHERGVLNSLAHECGFHPTADDPQCWRDVSRSIIVQRKVMIFFCRYIFDSCREAQGFLLDIRP